jgi:hypothetical protein
LQLMPLHVCVQVLLGPQCHQVQTMMVTRRRRKRSKWSQLRWMQLQLLCLPAAVLCSVSRGLLSSAYMQHCSASGRQLDLHKQLQGELIEPEATHDGTPRLWWPALLPLALCDHNGCACRRRAAGLLDPPATILGPSPVQSYLLAQDKAKVGGGHARAHVLVDATGAPPVRAGSGDDGNWRQRLVSVS